MKDGHGYVKEAMDNGAVASLWKKSYGTPPKGIPIIFVDDTLFALQQLAQFYRKGLDVKVIGITGSNNGKTTVKDIISTILSTTHRVHKTKGNFNSQIGLPLTILEMKRDTEFLILEMGMSEKGQIRNLSQIAQPDVAIITMIGQSHLETLGSREEISKAKLEIIDGLKEEGLLLYNGDETLLSRKNNVLVLECKSFGEKDTNDLFPTNVQLDEYGVHFKLNDSKIQYDVPLHGKHNILNMIVGIAVGQFYNVPTEKIQDALRQINITHMRFQFLTAKTGFTIINDAWNASPSSMKAAIETLEKLNAYEKKIIVIGDMLELGKEAETYHREIGKMLNQENISYVFTYGEMAEIVEEEAMKTYATGQVQSYNNKAKIAEEVLKIITKKDVVLLKGSRGMALEEIVQNWI